MSTVRVVEKASLMQINETPLTLQKPKITERSISPLSLRALNETWNNITKQMGQEPDCIRSPILVGEKSGILEVTRAKDGSFTCTVIS